MFISLIDFYILYQKIPHIILKYIFNPRRVISIYSMHMTLCMTSVTKTGIQRVFIIRYQWCWQKEKNNLDRVLKITLDSKGISSSDRHAYVTLSQQVSRIVNWLNYEHSPLFWSPVKRTLLQHFKQYFN